MLKISDIKLNKVSINHRDSLLGRIYRIRVHVVSNPSDPATGLHKWLREHRGRGNL